MPGSVVGLYVDDHLRSKAVVVFDFPLAPGGSEAAIEDRQLPDNLVVNAREVLNIMASLFNVEGAAHLKLHAA
ncbi:hypothetical protein GTQ99_24040, partial [Kineococcus sp. T13]